ncbi:hypothetical protein PLANTIT3_60159 [Plantibacter sp. T3]|nr:hypothetical protein PLANTIT3_60159 [Plantibacter sp. T3]
MAGGQPAWCRDRGHQRPPIRDWAPSDGRAGLFVRLSSVRSHPADGCPNHTGIGGNQPIARHGPVT